MFGPLQERAIYDFISSEPVRSLDVLEARWARNESRLSPNGDAAWLAWAVRESANGAYLGKVDAEVDARGVATNLGYLFFPAYWGRGFASEAVRAVADHLLQHGVLELRATVTVGNFASERVLEKAGFIRTCILPNHDTIRGQLVDDVELVRVASPPQSPANER